MLDRLRRQASRRQGRLWPILIHDFLALIEEAHDGGTGLALRRCIDRGKHLFGPLGFAQVLFKRRLCRLVLLCRLSDLGTAAVPCGCDGVTGGSVTRPSGVEMHDVPNFRSKPASRSGDKGFNSSRARVIPACRCPMRLRDPRKNELGLPSPQHLVEVWRH